MGHYGSEMSDDHARAYRPYYPKLDELPPLTKESLAWNIARANKAEAELAEIKRQLGQFRKLLEGCYPW